LAAVEFLFRVVTAAGNAVPNHLTYIFRAAEHARSAVSIICALRLAKAPIITGAGVRTLWILSAGRPASASALAKVLAAVIGITAVAATRRT